VLVGFLNRSTLPAEVALIPALILLALIAWYVVVGRTWLKDKPWTAWLYKSRVGEWIELTFFKKSETILWSRLKGLGAALLVILPQVGALDLTPFLDAIPPEYHWVRFIPSIALMLDSVVGEMQRNRTTKPIELVALPNAVQADVAIAEAKFEEAKLEAVAVVADAKRAGEV
jgi:hypothetical protein